MKPYPSRVLVLLALAFFLTCSATQAAGFVIIGPIDHPIIMPPHPPRPIPHPEPVRVDQPISIKSHQVDVTVRDGVAVTTVEQVFHNPNNRQFEGQYIFPLHQDAAVHDFSIWMNGKETKGELLDANKARTIYEDIVRRMKDPGLLEYVDRRMVRCRIFPIPAGGDFRVKLSYTQKLEADADFVEYRYPLRVRGGHTSPENGSLTVTVDIQHHSDILNVYSPSHTVDIVRKDAKHLKVSFEESRAVMEKDFQLFFNVSKKDVGLGLMTHKPDREDGTFMAILTPRDTSNQDEIVGKDVIFVLDTSGSMVQDNKIEQAKKALTFCLASLNEKDRFGLVTFSTEAAAYKPELQSATRDNITPAIDFVKEKIQARGGTAIDDALKMALKMNTDTTRPCMVVFLTDGEPTIGERNPETILKNVTSVTRKNVRLFSFGVGYDVNVDLLQMLAKENRGAPTFVVPKENIEVKVSSFYTRIASPVFTDVKVDFVGLDTRDVFPRTFGDLFRDQQLVIVGRYSGGGNHAIRLRGMVNGKEKEIVYETSFPETESENGFLTRIWALKKVGYLLDSIQGNKHGNNEELKEEIVRLSKLHGIMTPYTSWLVIEDERRDGGPTEEGFGQALRESQLDDAVSGVTASPRRLPSVNAPGAPAADMAPAESVQLKEYAESLKGAGESGLHFGKRDSADADRLRRQERGANVSAEAEQKALQAALGRGGSSRVLDELADEEKLKKDGTYEMRDKAGRTLMREVGGKTFYRRGEAWVDSAYDAEMKTTQVVCFSAEYFALLKKAPNLGEFFALGKAVIVVHDGVAYEVTPE